MRNPGESWKDVVAKTLQMCATLSMENEELRQSLREMIDLACLLEQIEKSMFEELELPYSEQIRRAKALAWREGDRNEADGG